MKKKEREIDKKRRRRRRRGRHGGLISTRAVHGRVETVAGTGPNLTRTMGTVYRGGGANPLRLVRPCAVHNVRSAERWVSRQSGAQRHQCRPTAAAGAAAAVKQVMTGKQVVIKEWMTMTSTSPPSSSPHRLRRRTDGPTPLLPSSSAATI